MSFLFDLFLLIPLFVIGGVCSYTDIKHGKIFNKWIIRGLLWGIVFYLLLFSYNYFLLEEPSNNKYLLEVLINTLTSFFVGYLLWYFRLWSAGDAKLFIVFALLLPLSFYSKSYLNYFPSFNLLINLFIPLFLALTINALLVGLKEIFIQREKLKNFDLIKSLKGSSLRIKNLVKNFLKQFLSFMFLSIFLQRITSFNSIIPSNNILLGPISFFILFYITSNFLFKIQEKKKGITLLINGIVFLYSAFLIFSGKIQELAILFQRSLVFMVFIILFRQILFFYIEKKEVSVIKVKELKKGSVLSEKELNFISKNISKRKEIEEKFGRVSAEGLSELQAKIIKNLFLNNPEVEIKTYNTFPFAPFMLLSVIISIVTHSSFINFLFNKP